MPSANLPASLLNSLEPYTSNMRLWNKSKSCTLQFNEIFDLQTCSQYYDAATKRTHDFKFHIGAHAHVEDVNLE